MSKTKAQVLEDVREENRKLKEVCRELITTVDNYTKAPRHYAEALNYAIAEAERVLK